MTIKGIAAFGDTSENTELGLCWVDNHDSVRLWKFLLSNRLPIAVPSDDLLKFVELYSKIGPASIADFSVKEV